MTDPILIAILGLAGIVGAALFSLVGVVLGLLWRRFVHAQATNNSLWLYTRILIDAYYRDVKSPPPPPPDYIAHLYDTGVPS